MHYHWIALSLLRWWILVGIYLLKITWTSLLLPLPLCKISACCQSTPLPWPADHTRCWATSSTHPTSTGRRPCLSPQPPWAQAVWATPHTREFQGPTERLADCPFPQLCVTVCHPKIAELPIGSFCLSLRFCGGSELVFGCRQGQETDTVSLPPFSTPSSRELHTRRLCLLLQLQPSPWAAWLPSAHLPSDHQTFQDPRTPHCGHSPGASWNCCSFITVIRETRL